MLLQEPYWRNNYKSLSHSNTFFISVLSQRQTAKWCRHESSPRIVLAHRANGWQRSTHRGGKQFQIVGMQNWSKKKYIYIYVFGVVVFYYPSSFLHCFIHQMPREGARVQPPWLHRIAPIEALHVNLLQLLSRRKDVIWKFFSKELEMYFLFILFRWRIGFGLVVDCMNRNLNMDGRWQNYIDHTWLYLVLTQCIHN